MAARSIVKIRLLLMLSGTAPDAICAARPSTTAVFPTPGSPTRQGLFFVRLLKTCISLWISASRPITGSSFPSSACKVRSVPYCGRTPSLPLAPSCDSSSWYSFGLTPITCNNSCSICCTFKFNVRRIRVPTQSDSRSIASSICSVPISFARNRRASILLSSKINRNRGLNSGFSANVIFPTGEISSSTTL